MKLSVILLAGGTGTRMGGVLPKQFLPLNGKPIARHSFDTFASLDEVVEIVVVCEERYRSHFHSEKKSYDLRFAEPGERRQDSVYNGFRTTSADADLICIHDSARPFVTRTI